MDKVLALDLGDARIGVAIGHIHSEMIFPRAAVIVKEMKAKQVLKHLIQSEKISLVLVGLPLSNDLRENAQSAKIRKQIKALLEGVNVELEFVNEYGTTAGVKSIFNAYGLSTKNDSGTVDSSAAMLLIENYFKSKKVND